MDNNHDDDRKSNDHFTRKEKFYAIHQEIAKLIAEEQMAAATDGTSILNAVTECKSPTIVQRSESKKIFYLKY
jgi:hypothetical protein